MSDYLFLSCGPDCIFDALVCPECEQPCDELWCVDGATMCKSCRKDYRADHPDMEEAIAHAEYMEDR